MSGNRGMTHFAAKDGVTPIVTRCGQGEGQRSLPPVA